MGVTKEKWWIVWNEKWLRKSGTKIHSPKLQTKRKQDKSKWKQRRNANHCLVADSKLWWFKEEQCAKKEASKNWKRLVQESDKISNPSHNWRRSKKIKQNKPKKPNTTTFAKAKKGRKKTEKTKRQRKQSKKGGKKKKKKRQKTSHLNRAVKLDTASIVLRWGTTRGVLCCSLFVLFLKFFVFFSSNLVVCVLFCLVSFVLCLVSFVLCLVSFVLFLLSCVLFLLSCFFCLVSFGTNGQQMIGYFCVKTKVNVFSCNTKCSKNCTFFFFPFCHWMIFVFLSVLFCCVKSFLLCWKSFLLCWKSFLLCWKSFLLRWNIRTNIQKIKQNATLKRKTFITTHWHFIFHTTKTQNVMLHKNKGKVKTQLKILTIKKLVKLHQKTNQMHNNNKTMSLLKYKKLEINKIISEIISLEQQTINPTSQDPKEDLSSLTIFLQIGPSATWALLLKQSQGTNESISLNQSQHQGWQKGDSKSYFEWSVTLRLDHNLSDKTEFNSSKGQCMPFIHLPGVTNQKKQEQIDKVKQQISKTLFVSFPDSLKDIEEGGWNNPEQQPQALQQLILKKTGRQTCSCHFWIKRRRWYNSC